VSHTNTLTSLICVDKLVLEMRTDDVEAGRLIIET
jgi:hypothetical protein